MKIKCIIIHPIFKLRYIKSLEKNHNIGRGIEYVKNKKIDNFKLFIKIHPIRFVRQITSDPNKILLKLQYNVTIF